MQFEYKGILFNVSRCIYQLEFHIVDFLFDKSLELSAHNSLENLQKSSTNWIEVIFNLIEAHRKSKKVQLKLNN